MAEVEEGEQVYLSCKECGEVFDSLTFAWEHMKEEFLALAQHGVTGHEGFDLVPEAEAI